MVAAPAQFEILERIQKMGLTANGAGVRTLGTELLTVRIELDEY